MSSPDQGHTLLPRDACLYALRATTPHLTRASLHRCRQRHGIRRLLEIEVNGTHFTTPGNVASAASLIKEANAAGETFRARSFEAACARNDVEHRLAKPRCPWTHGQVERMNRTLKDATVRRDHDDIYVQLRMHVADFVAAYDFGPAAQDRTGSELPTRPSAKPGLPSRTGSRPTRSTKCRDQTASSRTRSSARHSSSPRGRVRPPWPRTAIRPLA